MFWFKKKKEEETKTVQEGKISFNDFIKVDLRVGKILECSRVQGSDKLLKLKVNFGSSNRQILAGIGRQYTPESLTGKTATFVFNLVSRTMMGLESQGMILAVSDEKGLSILSPDKEIKPGTKAS